MTTPVTVLPYESDVPDIDIDEARRDYFDIWQKNISTVIQQRLTDGESGNYGSDDEGSSFSVDKEIYLNIQGNGSDTYSREKYGIDTSSKTWHCYALHTEDIRNDDRIIWNGNRFIIRNLNQGIHHGERCFWEFDIVSIDKDVSSFP